MVTSVSINQGGRFRKHSQRLGERKVQAELTEKQMQVSILEELLAAVDFAAVVYGSRFGFHDTQNWRSAQFPTHEIPSESKSEDSKFSVFFTVASPISVLTWYERIYS